MIDFDNKMDYYCYCCHPFCCLLLASLLLLACLLLLAFFCCWRPSAGILTVAGQIKLKAISWGKQQRKGWIVMTRKRRRIIKQPSLNLYCSPKYLFPSSERYRFYSLLSSFLKIIFSGNENSSPRIHCRVSGGSLDHVLTDKIQVKYLINLKLMRSVI